MLEMIKVHVLRSVLVSEDGLTGRKIVAGTDDYVAAGLVADLVAENYVSIEATTPDTPLDAGSDDLVPKHIGRGKWCLMRGDERVHGPFDSREEAASFIARA